MPKNNCGVGEVIRFRWNRKFVCLHRRFSGGSGSVTNPRLHRKRGSDRKLPAFPETL